MFNKNSEPRRRKGGVGIIRLFMSLIILFFLAVGGYTAFRHFSGLDPLKLDPQSIAKNLISSKKISNVVNDLLTINPQDPLTGVKKVLSSEKSTSGGHQAPKTIAPLEFKFAVIADSHKDYSNLTKALQQAKKEGAEFVVGMGDLSDVGTIDELTSTKKTYDDSGFTYYIGAGDHDLWDSTNKKLDSSTNFKQVFGPPYQSFSSHNIRFIMLFNSDNYNGMDQVELSWLESELQRVSSDGHKLLFVFAPTPLYHPSSDHVMGKVTPSLKDQADHIISLLARAKVNQVFSADTHFFLRYKEPKNDIDMVTVGAVTADRNPQTPRFAMVDVFTDGSYNIREVEIE